MFTDASQQEGLQPQLHTSGLPTRNRPKTGEPGPKQENQVQNSQELLLLFVPNGWGPDSSPTDFWKGGH